MNLPITLGLAGLVTVAIAFVSLSQPVDQSTPSTAASPIPTPLPETTSPQRLTINVSVAQLEDLKVKEGQTLKAGDLIADRGRERSRLESQKAQLQLSFQRLKTATITPPLPPDPIPAIAAPPPASYLEQESAVEQAKSLVEQAEAAVTLKKQEIEYLSSLENLNPLVMEHEQAQLAELERQHTAAVRDYQLAMGKLDTAHQSQAYQQYRHSIDLAERIESQNAAALEYQQQLAAYEQRNRDREYQVSQIQLKLDEVNNAIATLAVIRAPYDGKVRRVRWLGQGTDGSLTAEVTLILSGTGDSSTLPDQQPGLFESTD